MQHGGSGFALRRRGWQEREAIGEMYGRVGGFVAPWGELECGYFETILGCGPRRGVSWRLGPRQ